MKFHYPLALGVIFLVSPTIWAQDIEYITDNYAYDLGHRVIVQERVYSSPPVVVVPSQPVVRYYGSPTVVVRPRYYYRYYDYPSYYYYNPAPFRSYRYYEYPQYHSRYFYNAPDHYRGFTFRYYHR